MRAPAQVYLTTRFGAAAAPTFRASWRRLCRRQQRATKLAHGGCVLRQASRLPGPGARPAGQGASRSIRGLSAAAAVLTVLLVVACLAFIFAESVNEQLFQAGTPLTGSLWRLLGVSLITSAAGALAALPVALRAGAYLAGRPDSRTTRLLVRFIDTASGVPTVVLGLCLSILVLPLIAADPSLAQTPFVPGIVISLGNFVYLLPHMTDIFRRRAAEVPRLACAGALALGADWRQTVGFLYLPASRKASTAAFAAGLARGVGQTMITVLLLIAFGRSASGSAGTLTSAILGAARQSLEPGTPEYSATFLFGLVLLLCTGGLNHLSRKLGRGADL